ncbi:MAG: hypothetical protein ACK5PP_03920 [Acidimicrobiales bacterium]
MPDAARPARSPSAGPPTGRSTLTTPVTAPDGGIVVVKVRRPVSWAAEATAAEAEWLTAAAGPGIVPLLAAGVDRLATGWAGPVSVASCADRLAADPDRVVAMVAGVVRVLDRIAGAGLVHGRIRAEHVILGGADRSRVALCSPVAGPSGPDAGAGRGGRGDAADDLVALGDLAAGLSAGWRNRHPGWDQLVTALRAEPDRLDPGRVAGRLAELGPLRGPGVARWWGRPDRLRRR